MTSSSPAPSRWELRCCTGPHTHASAEVSLLLLFFVHLWATLNTNFHRFSVGNKVFFTDCAQQAEGKHTDHTFFHPAAPRPKRNPAQLVRQTSFLPINSSDKIKFATTDTHRSYAPTDRQRVHSGALSQTGCAAQLWSCEFHSFASLPPFLLRSLLSCTRKHW